MRIGGFYDGKEAAVQWKVEIVFICFRPAATHNYVAEFRIHEPGGCMDGYVPPRRCSNHYYIFWLYTSMEQRIDLFYQLVDIYTVVNFHLAVFADHIEPAVSQGIQDIQVLIGPPFWHGLVDGIVAQ